MNASGDPRRAAFDVLRAVAERDAYANLALPAILARHHVTGRDAALATELAYGTLRGEGFYDAVLAACLDRPTTALDAPVLDVLRLGTHQLLSMRVPSHAAVSTSVDLARGVAGHGPARLVNAVLRRVARDDLDVWRQRVAHEAGADELSRLAAVHSHPRWIAVAFADALGGDLAATEAAFAADNDRPLVTLVARPGRSEVAELTELGATPGRWSPYAAVLADGDPARLAPVAQGRAGVQDEGSQLVAVALANAPVEGRDERWLDVAAGPGGKAALLAAIGAQRGAHLLAAELQPHRAALVARAAPDAMSVVADGTTPPWHAGAFDRVLADVPCTGLSALRRRPEARWRRTSEDLDSLVPLQRALLTAALDAARPGGVVAYATCSPHLAETRDVIATVTAGRDDVEPVDVRPLLPGVPHLGEGPAVQLWPHLHGTDAMHIAIFRKG